MDYIREDEPDTESEEENDQFSFSDESVDEIDWINDNRYNDIKRELTRRLRQIKEKEQEEKAQKVQEQGSRDAMNLSKPQEEKSGKK